MDIARALSVCLLTLTVLSGCDSDSDGVTGTPEPVVLEFQGQILSDAWDEPLQVPVHLRVFRSDGRGGWNETESNEAGRWAMSIELRDGCEPGQSLEGAAWITARDHRPVDEDLGEARPVVCDPEPQTLDYNLYRRAFRTPVPVAGGLQASAVSGFLNTCAVTAQGTYCWGVSGMDAAAPVPVSGSESFQAVEAGHSHHCALDGDGAAWCWGSNHNGVLGVREIQESSDPVSVETDLRFVELAANSEATCGRDGEGRLYCWGMYGAETPSLFGGDLRFEQLSAAWAHMCGIEVGSGQIWCWGENVWGELGFPERERADEPVLIQGVDGVRELATGASASCALDDGGELWCWGWNCDGQLGSPGPSANPVPRLLEGWPPLTQIAMGYGFTCGLTDDGQTWCWGRNERGQLGAASDPEHRSADPVRVSGELRFDVLTTGFRSACGITDHGELYCWGDRAYLGTGLPLAAGAGAPGSAARAPNDPPSLLSGSSCPS